MDALWPNIVVSDDSITQCIIDVRRALGRESSHLLRTVPRRGYIFEAEVVRQEAKPFPQIINSQGARTRRRPLDATSRDGLGESRPNNAGQLGKTSALSAGSHAFSSITSEQDIRVLSDAPRSPARVCGGRAWSAIGQKRTLVYTPRIRVGKCRKNSQCHYEGACCRIPVIAIRRPRHWDVGLGG